MLSPLNMIGEDLLVVCAWRVGGQKTFAAEVVEDVCTVCLLFICEKVLTHNTTLMGVGTSGGKLNQLETSSQSRDDVGETRVLLGIAARLLLVRIAAE